MLFTRFKWFDAVFMSKLAIFSKFQNLTQIFQLFLQDTSTTRPKAFNCSSFPQITTDLATDDHQMNPICTNYEKWEQLKVFWAGNRLDGSGKQSELVAIVSGSSLLSSKTAQLSLQNFIFNNFLTKQKNVEM